MYNIIYIISLPSIKYIKELIRKHVLVVTESTNSIDKAYAKELRKNWRIKKLQAACESDSFSVVILNRNLEKLQNTSKEEILLINSKMKIKLITVDFSKEKEVFNKIHTELGNIPIDILDN
jgi:hypothetical protein